MPALDAPDFQRVVTTVLATGDVPDAPDFQRIVVSPGGTPVGGSGTPAPGNVFTAAGFTGITMWPSAATGSASVQSGRVYLFAFTPLINTPLFSCNFCVHTVGVSTANECFVVVYTGGLGLVAASATGAADTAFEALGWQQVLFSTTPTLTMGDLYYMGFIFTGTGLQLYSAVGDSNLAINPQANTILSGESTSAHTNPPASLPNLAFTQFTPIMFLF